MFPSRNKEKYNMSKIDKIVYGIRPVGELIRGESIIKKVWLEHGKALDIKRECLENGIDVIEKSGRFLEKICSNSKHQGVVAKYVPKEREICFDKESYRPRLGNLLCLYLDRIQDPQNFGAIVRSAEFFGVDQIFYPEFENAPFNEVAMKASSGGGIHNPPYKISSISNFFQKVKEKNISIIGTKPLKGVNLKKFDFNKDVLLVIGNESSGISKKVEKYCDNFIKIPKLGNVDSLNASVSTGVMLYQIRSSQ